MKFEHLFRAFGQAMGETMASNGKFHFEFDNTESEEWCGLGELAFGEPAPTRLKVALSRRDTVKVTQGKGLAIMVDGDGIDALRFRRDGDLLRIRRRSKTEAGLTIAVTMAAPEEIAIGGAGTVEAEKLSDIARIAIGGSGTIRVTECTSDLVTAKIGGSGRIEIGGRTEALELAIGGSGSFASAELEVDIAKIRIGGSGKAEFASDGEVDARIGGSGDILVHGKPRCSMRAGGSGRIRCVPRGTDTEAA